MLLNYYSKHWLKDKNHFCFQYNIQNYPFDQKMIFLPKSQCSTFIDFHHQDLDSAHFVVHEQEQFFCHVCSPKSQVRKLVNFCRTKDLNQPIGVCPEVYR